MRKGRFEREKEKRREIAKERVTRLLEMAEKRGLSGDLKYASRYASLARRISMRYNVRMPRRFKLLFCKDCESYLQPSVNSKVRLTGGRITRVCTSCGGRYRVPIKNKPSTKKE